MENDLISREALKEDLIIKFGNQLPLSLLDEIDNAPTVAVDEEIERQREELYQSSKKLFDTARMLGVERPQGEWITTRTMVHDGNPYCSICDEENIIRTKFCPNCGADMR